MKKNILRISFVLTTLIFAFIEAKGEDTNLINFELSFALSTPSPTGAGTVYVKEGQGPTMSNAETTPVTYNAKHPYEGPFDFYFIMEANSNPGYHFVGWYENANASGAASSTDNPYTYHTYNGTNMNPRYASLYGHFAANKYTVTYEPNGGSGLMQPSSFTYGAENILKSNTFNKIAIITYNTQGGEPINPISIVQEFNNWRSSQGEEYPARANLKTYVTENNSTVELSAQWKPVSVTLPTPTKTVGGSSVGFRGWFDAPGGKLIGTAGSTVQLPDNTTLYAVWDDGYNITINVMAEGFAEGQSAVFSVRNSSNSINYTVPVALCPDSKVTLTGLPAGTYTVAPIGWNWDFTSTPATINRDVSDDTIFSFTLKYNGSNTVHDEKSVKIIWQN